MLFSKFPPTSPHELHALNVVNVSDTLVLEESDFVLPFARLSLA